MQRTFKKILTSASTGEQFDLLVEIGPNPDGTLGTDYNLFVPFDNQREENMPPCVVINPNSSLMLDEFVTAPMDVVEQCRHEMIAVNALLDEKTTTKMQPPPHSDSRALTKLLDFPIKDELVLKPGLTMDGTIKTLEEEMLRAEFEHFDLDAEVERNTADIKARSATVPTQGTGEGAAVSAVITGAGLPQPKTHIMPPP